MVQYQLTQGLCQGRAARLTCQGDLTPLVFESCGQALDVGRFARPIDAFETNKKPSFCHAQFVKTQISLKISFAKMRVSVKRLFCLCSIAGLASSTALVTVHSGVVSVQRFAKCATAIAACDEIQRIAGIGVQSGAQRIASRHSDRGGWQAFARVGVPRMVRLQINSA